MDNLTPPGQAAPPTTGAGNWSVVLTRFPTGCAVMAPDQLVMTLSRRRRTRCWREEHESWDVFPPIRSVSPCVRAGLCVETI